MISLRKARVADAIAIGAVHVAAWRSTYPGILPDDYLARLSPQRQATRQRQHERATHRAAGGTDTGRGSLSPRSPNRTQKIST